MKTLKRIGAVLLALAMLAALSGCSGLEARLLRASTRLARLESLRMDIQFDSRMGVTLFGRPMGLDLLMDGQSDILLKPLAVYMDVEAQALGQSQRLQSYLRENDADYDLYLSVDGESWSHKTLSRDEKPEQTEPLEQLKVLLALADNFEESGKETIRGQSATVYSGVIAGSYVRELLEGTGLLASLGKALEVDLSELELEDLGGVPVTLALGDKSGLPLRYTLDLTEVLHSVLDAVLKELLRQNDMGDLNLDALGVSATVEKALFTAECYDFDQVGELNFPEEALSAA